MAFFTSVIIFALAAAASFADCACVTTPKRKTASSFFTFSDASPVTVTVLRSSFAEPVVITMQVNIQANTSATILFILFSFK